VLKGIGYLISCVSVVCLGVTAWSSAAERPQMLAFLIIGMSTAILGMALRFLSHLREKRPEAQTRISK
jgi:hypothetical protein